MIICPACNTSNVDNTLFCAECGAYLSDQQSPRTDAVGIKFAEWGADTPDPTPPDPSASRGTGPLAINLMIGNKEREVQVPLDKPIHMGRLDPGASIFPEIDLTPDGGVEMGVSRRHARIMKREQQIYIEDLNSSNGTFVNGQKLMPHFPEVISDGDEVRLGKLHIKVMLRQR